MTFLLNLITAAVLYGTPLLYGTSGEILTEKSGNLNLGVEGMMFMGGALGLGAAFYYEKLAGAAVSAPLAGGLPPAAPPPPSWPARWLPCSSASSPSPSGPTRTSPAWPSPSSAPAWASTSVNLCGCGRAPTWPSATP